MNKNLLLLVSIIAFSGCGSSGTSREKIQTLQKAHNARCKREGSHKTQELLTLQESKFVGVTCKLQQQISTSAEATLVIFGDAEVEQFQSRSNTANRPSSNWWTFPLCFVKRQTDRQEVQHWLIQNTFQQSSVSFKNQVQDAETEIIENVPVWLSLCGLDFFSVPRDVWDIFPLVHQANEDAPVESISLQPVDSTSVSQTSLTCPSTPSKVLRSQACQANSPQIKTDSQVKRNILWKRDCSLPLTL